MTNAHNSRIHLLFISIIALFLFNSDGDYQMLQWTASNTQPHMEIIVHHTDAVREWAYDSTSHIGKLDKGLDDSKKYGWLIVDMKNDWKTVFPDK